MSTFVEGVFSFAFQAGVPARRLFVWLPMAWSSLDFAAYQQFLLHTDSRQRFSIVSFVWGAGQATPVHDHTVWGLIGVLRGAEIAQGYHLTSDGVLEEGAAKRPDTGRGGRRVAAHRRHPSREQCFW
jgi:hypothetical protein